MCGDLWRWSGRRSSVSVRKKGRVDTAGGLKPYGRWVQCDLFCILGLSLGFIISLAY